MDALGRVCALALVVFTAAACSVEGPGSSRAGAAVAEGSASSFRVVVAGPDEGISRALAALAKNSGSAWTVSFDARTGTPSVLIGRWSPSVAMSAPEAIARAFFRDNASVWGIRNADEELALVAVEGSARSTFVRLAQRAAGVRVLGASLSVQIEEGAIVAVRGRFAPSAVKAGSVPKLDAQSAVRAAASATDTGARASARTELVVVVDGGAPFLAWAVTIDTGSRAGVVLVVDARTGAIVA